MSYELYLIETEKFKKFPGCTCPYTHTKLGFLGRQVHGQNYF
jgi:hypothetical protein